MKVMRIVFCFCAISVLTMAAVSAQNGAVVVKGEDIFGWFEWNGESVVAIMSSDSEFFCNAEFGDLMWADWMMVFRPDGSIKWHDRGFYFTRVFYPATEDDFWADRCALWNNESLMVAEGIAHTTTNDNDLDVSHPNRRNVGGYTVAGTLYDYAGLCEDGMVGLNIVRRAMLEKGADWPACYPDCLIPLAMKGPRLSCP